MRLNLLQRLLVTLLPLFLTLAWPVLAFASGGGGEHGEGGHGDGGHGSGTEMFQDILVLLAVISVAYLITHLFLERIQRRFGLVSGVEYIVLGVLIGPALGVLDATTLSKFTPAVVLGTGSLGLITGLNLNFRRFHGIDWEALRVALWISFVTFVAVVVVPLALLYVFQPMDVLLRWMRGIVCVGAIAMVASPGPVLSLRKFMSAKGDAADGAIRVAGFCSSMAVIIFGLLFCMFDHEAVLLPAQYSMIEWFGVHLILGVVLGLVFATFLRRDFDDDKLLTIIIGMVIFTSGIAYYLRLSPIFVNLVMGVILANVSKQSLEVEKRLDTVQRPLYIVLFFFAGASLTFDAPIWAFALAIPYLLVRSGARLAGGVIAMRTTHPDNKNLRIPPLGRVMLAPGALSVAMLLDFQAVFGNYAASSTVYASMIVAILSSEILSYIRTRSWLLDHTDVAPSTIRQVLSGTNVEVA